MDSWYLIYTKPQQEDLAQENLERQGYPVYLPKIRGRKKQRGRTVRVVQPMFPRYLFIHLSNTTDDWGPIRSTIGVSKLVRFGQDAARVPDTLIEALKSRAMEDGIHELPGQEYIAGQKIHISEGPFEGYEAVFSAKQANDRVLVLLKIAETYVKVQLEKGVLAGF